MLTIEQIVLADDPELWAALGFAVEGETVLLGSIRLRLAGRDAGRGILGWSLRGIDEQADLDGLPTTAATAPRDAASATPVDAAPAMPTGSGSAEPAGDVYEHPNGVCAIDHVVAFSPRLDRSVQALRAAGLDLRRIREQPTPAGAPRQAFFRLGETILEVVQISEQEVAQAGGADAPARFWGLALLTRDLERTAHSLGEHVDAVRPAVQRGRSIATLRRSAGLAVPVALMSARDAGTAAPRATI